MSTQNTLICLADTISQRTSQTISNTITGSELIFFQKTTTTTTVLEKHGSSRQLQWKYICSSQISHTRTYAR